MFIDCTFQEYCTVHEGCIIIPCTLYECCILYTLYGYIVCYLQELYQAGLKKVGTDESKFNMILCSQSYEQLRVVFDEYHRAANQSLEQSIKSEMSGDLETGMLAIGKLTNCKLYWLQVHDTSYTYAIFSVGNPILAICKLYSHQVNYTGYR